MTSPETRRRKGTQRFLAPGGLCLLCALAAAAGCAQATARPRTDPLPLSIPEPPPRVVEQLPEVEELPAEPPRREPTGTVGPARPQRASRENGTVAKVEPKTEPPKADPGPSPVEPPAVTPPSPTPARPELRTPETADEESAVREVRDTLERASKLLAKVDYRSLRRDARLQYDTAKRFIEQADEALKARNPVAAQYLAGKAETIAKGLGGR